MHRERNAPTRRQRGREIHVGRLPPLHDVLNLIQFLAIRMICEIIQERQLKLTQSKGSDSVGSSGEAKSTLTPLLIHAVAALVAVLLEGLIAHSILVQQGFGLRVLHGVHFHATLDFYCD